jgi:hypothetical protein
VKLLEAALAYASWGWPVLPILPNSKLPACAHGVHDATTDTEQITRWFADRDDLNIAIAAGSKSGLVVFDVDPRNGGESSWESWTAVHGDEPSGALQLTAGGGQHYLAGYVDGVRSCKLRDGIDLLSDGRYFLAFPSTIEGRSYAWEISCDPFDGLAPFAIPPRWLAGMRPAPRAPVVVGAEIIRGNRNDGLTAMAGAMRRYGLAEAEILAAIAVANETRCDVPLPASEVAQIARSVARYDPESDVAAAAALGSEAAEELLAGLKEQTRDYFFTRATSYLDQPAPLEWLVRGWVPASGTTMVFGESGAGKTFVTLDIACSIAAGLDWAGRKTRKGIAIYLAGEGNFGIRQRVKAWCVSRGVSCLDNLLISNKAIDLDGSGAAAEIISAVRELTSDSVASITIDTTNNHMSGDENSARDVRNFFNAANVVAAALSAAVTLNHHVGHGEGAKSRARGSSAFKASLDAAIMVSKDDNGLIALTCEKMKDAEAPAPLAGRLVPVPLGWHDEDGQEIVGAVFSLSEETPEPKRQKADGKTTEFRKLFEKAWWSSGCELHEEAPYVSRSALREYLEKNTKLSQASISQYLKPAGKLVQLLVTAGIVTQAEHGWFMSDIGHAAALRAALKED